MLGATLPRQEASSGWPLGTPPRGVGGEVPDSLGPSDSWQVWGQLAGNRGRQSQIQISLSAHGPQLCSCPSAPYLPLFSKAKSTSYVHRHKALESF